MLLRDCNTLDDKMLLRDCNTLDDKMLLTDCNTLEDIKPYGAYGGQSDTTFFFSSTSLFLPHYHATKVLYTFSHLLPTMYEMEMLCVSENACSTPECSQIVNKNKQIMNSGLLLFPKDIEGKVASKCFSVRTDIRCYCFSKYFLPLRFFHNRRNEGRPLKRLLDVSDRTGPQVGQLDDG